MQNLIKKWLEVQKAIKPIEKDSQNPHFKSWYFDISKLLADVKPILSAQGLVLMQPITVLEGRPAILTTIIDAETCEKIEAPMLLPDIQDPQKMGAVISYYRRYALVSLLALEGEDDDAESAKPAATQPKAVQKPTAQTGHGVCKDCGAPNAFSQAKQKPYCSAKCWLEPKNAPLPVIKVDDREREEWVPPEVE